MEMMGSLFAVLLLAGGCCGLRWTEQLRGEGEPVTLCSGHSLRLFWNFTLDPGEYLKGIVWGCEPDGEQEDIMATYMDGHFVPRSSFSGRLAHLQDGAIELSCTTILESGNYSIAVSTEDVNSHLTVHRKTVAVTVFDKPKTQTGEFHVTRKEEAVRDVITGAWHMHLSCGNFSDLGHPPVDVIWTTPKGAQLTSTGFQYGVFYLMVPNPATGGTYTCTIPASQPAARCLDSDSPLLDTASVNVDEVMVKLLLLEARQHEFENRTEALHQEFKDSLEAERNVWKDAIGQMGNRTEALQQEFKDSLEAERNVWKDAIGQMGNRTEARQQEFEDRTEALQQEFKDSLEAERDVWMDAIGQMGNRTEARHQDFEDRTEALQQEFEDKTEALQQEFKDSLKAEKDVWMDAIGQMGNRTEAIQQDFEDRLKAERYTWRGAIGQMDNRTEVRHQEFEDRLKAAKNVWKNTIGQMGNRTEALEQWRGDAVRNSAPVSFHARLSSHTELSDGAILKLGNVISNQGGGYNPTTGYFTAPVSGTYFFIGTTGPYGSGKYADMYLVKEGSILARTYLRRYDNYPTMGSCHGALHLKAGQSVWLRSWGTGHFHSYTTAFSGFRVR